MAPSSSAGSGWQGVSASVADLVAESALACVLLELPSETVLAASPTMAEILRTGPEVAGRSFEEFLADEPTGAHLLLETGRVKGYEAVRQLVGDRGELRLWVQPLPDSGPGNFAIAAVLEAGEVSGQRLRAAGSGAPPVFGTFDAALVVDRVSGEVESVLGRSVDEVIGRSFLELVGDRGVPAALLSLAEASATGEGVSERLRAEQPPGCLVDWELMLFPLEPRPSAAFAIVPGPPVGPDAAGGDPLERVLARLGRSVGGRDVDDEPAAELLAGLSSREREIVGYLAAGDRVPRIAASMYLSQSTIRNHLSSVFRKLGIHSQQELVHLLRNANVRS